MRGQPVQETQQHAAVFVVHRAFKRRTRTRWQPRWVANDDGREAFGRKQIGLHHLDRVGQAQAVDVFAGAFERARVHVGGHHLIDFAAQRQHGRQHAGAGADVEHHKFGIGRIGRQGRVGHQIDIFAAHRRKHAVMRMDAVVGCLAQSGDFNAFLAPLVRADHAHQFAQRRHAGQRCFADRAPDLGAGLFGIGCAAQINTVVRAKLDQHHAQHPRALRLRLPVQVKFLPCRNAGDGVVGVFFQLDAGQLGGFGRLVDAPGQRLHHLPGVLEVTAPEQAGAFAGQAVGGVGGHRVVGFDDAPGWRRAALGTPQRRMRHARFLPFDKGRAGGGGFRNGDGSHGKEGRHGQSSQKEKSTCFNRWRGLRRTQQPAQAHFMNQKALWRTSSGRKQLSIL